MSTFTRLPGSNGVVYTDDYGDKYFWSTNVNIFPHPENGQAIYITTESNTNDLSKGIVINAIEVTDPNPAGDTTFVLERDNLIDILSKYYFSKDCNASLFPMPFNFSKVTSVDGSGQILTKTFYDGADDSSTVNFVWTYTWDAYGNYNIKVGSIRSFA